MFFPDLQNLPLPGKTVMEKTPKVLAINAKTWYTVLNVIPYRIFKENEERHERFGL